MQANTKISVVSKLSIEYFENLPQMNFQNFKRSLLIVSVRRDFDGSDWFLSLI